MAGEVVKPAERLPRDTAIAVNDDIATVRLLVGALYEGVVIEDGSAVAEGLAALDRLAARLQEAECQFGCGPDTSGQYVNAGAGLVSACPVHGWMAPFMDAAGARAEAAELRAEEAERERDEAWERNVVAYSRMHDAWYAETARAEAAELRVAALQDGLPANLAEILAAATPGPWTVSHSEIVAVIANDDIMDAVAIMGNGQMDESEQRLADADLIALAPVLARALLAGDEANSTSTPHDARDVELEALRARVAELQDGLREILGYEDDGTSPVWQLGPSQSWPEFSNRKNRARALLAGDGAA